MNNSNSILRYFDTSHLKSPLNNVSVKFQSIALYVDDALPDGPEKSTCLRKLLEAKDAGVRAALDLGDNV